jgi:hypothetical protein
MDIIIRYYKLKGAALFCIIVVLNLILIYLSKKGLINEVVFYNTFSEQFTYDRSQKMFEEMSRFAWIGYVLTPLMLLIKFSLVSIVLFIGIVLFDIKEKVLLGSVFKIVIASEMVFIAANLAKFLWFYLFAGNYDLNDLGFFYPLSLINFFSTGDVNKLWIFPLQTANLFQLAYLVSISFGLNKVCQMRKPDSEKVVLVSYLPAMVLWIAFIMFLSIDSAS